jgi:hypothetical protein
LPPANLSLVLVQLYGSLGQTAPAARLVQQALYQASKTPTENNSDENNSDKNASAANAQATRSQVLLAASKFYDSLDPKLAETYCRQALQEVPNSASALTRLLEILAKQETPAATREGLQLLAQAQAAKPALRREDTLRRLEALLRVHRNGPDDRQAAILIFEGLLRRSGGGSAEDRANLARLYEADGRTLPALQQLENLASQPNVPLARQLALAAFLRRNAADNSQFMAQAERILQRLEAEPSTALYALRFRLQSGALTASGPTAAGAGTTAPADTQDPDSKVPGSQDPDSKAPDSKGPDTVQASRIIDQFVREHLLAADSSTEEPAARTAREGRFFDLLLMLLTDGRGEQAIGLCQNPQLHLDSATIGSGLATALTLTSATEEVGPQAEPLLERAL